MRSLFIARCSPKNWIPSMIIQSTLKKTINKFDYNFFLKKKVEKKKKKRKRWKVRYILEGEFVLCPRRANADKVIEATTC